MCARVAQWWSIALPRRGSRVRIPSRALKEIQKRDIRWMSSFCMFEPCRVRTVRMSTLRCRSSQANVPRTFCDVSCSQRDRRKSHPMDGSSFCSVFIHIFFPENAIPKLRMFVITSFCISALYRFIEICSKAFEDKVSNSFKLSPAFAFNSMIIPGCVVSIGIMQISERPSPDSRLDRIVY